MKTTLRSHFTVGAFALLLTGISPAADRLELTDGSLVCGKLLSAEGGKFMVMTAFAGIIEIAQDRIRTFANDSICVPRPGVKRLDTLSFTSLILDGE